MTMFNTIRINMHLQKPNFTVVFTEFYEKPD